MRPALFKFIVNPPPFAVLSRYTFRPSHTVFIQTDGSFKPQYSRTAVFINTHENKEFKLRKAYLDHNDSMESEWCSILDGIQYSIKHKHVCIELENDNQQVVQSLIERKSPNKQYLTKYYRMIYKEINGLEYFGIRWIPREFNKADLLL